MLRVMSYNVRLDTPEDGHLAWPHRKERVARLIERQAPDVIGVQEALARQVADLERLLPAYAQFGVGRDDGRDGGEFGLILYRKERFERHEGGTFWLSERPDEPGSVGWDAAHPRTATWATLSDRRSDRRLTFVTTHLDHVGSVAREQGAKLIRRRIRTPNDAAPVVVTGDFNATPGSAPVRVLCEALRDARSEADVREGPEATFFGFGMENRQGVRIDHVLVDAGILVRRYAVVDEHHDGSYPSDHLPIVVDLELQGRTEG